MRSSSMEESGTDLDTSRMRGAMTLRALVYISMLPPVTRIASNFLFVLFE